MSKRLLISFAMCIVGIQSLVSQQIETYIHLDTFSFSYYNDWELNADPDFNGEFIQLFRRDPENDTAIGGQHPNSAKVSFVLFDTAGMSLQEFVNERISDINDYSIETLSERNYETIRVKYTFWNPTIVDYILIDESQVLRIIGYHGKGSDEAYLIEGINMIQKSFRVVS